MDEEAPARLTLAQKIDHLFKTVHPKGRGEYTHREVAAAIEAQGGPTISGTYVWQLRKGVRERPTIAHIEALAKFFHVPPAYFLDDDVTATINKELSVLQLLRDTGLRRVALRSAGLSPAGLEAIVSMAEALRAAEGLPIEDLDNPNH